MNKSLVKFINFLYLDEKIKAFKITISLIIIGIALLILFIYSGFSFVFILITSVIIGSIVFKILDKLGKKKHFLFLDSKLSRQLKHNGFEIETSTDYRGMIQTISGRTVRIYYDWRKKAKGPLSFGDVVLEFFYTPILKEEQEMTIDTELLYKFTSKYENTFYTGYKLVFTVDRLIVNFNYYPWTNFSLISKKINFYLEKLNAEKLIPLDIGNVEDQFKRFEEDSQFQPFMKII